MASKAARGCEGRLALHWYTYSAHVLKKLAFPVEREQDRIALREIFRVQCHRDEARAMGLLEEIIRAPLLSSALHARYCEFWMWTEEGRPKRPSGPSLYALDECARCIRANLRRAA